MGMESNGSQEEIAGLPGKGPGFLWLSLSIWGRLIRQGITGQAADNQQLPIASEDEVGRESMKRKLWIYVMLLAASGLFASVPSYATTTVSFTVTTVSPGLYEYYWTVDYGGTASGDSSLGHVEIYFPFKYMNANSDANGGSKIGTFTGGGGTTVTLPYNAGHYGATGWAQSAIQLESFDQETHAEEYAEIDFNTTAADSGKYVYHFSYRLDSLVTSFYYELHTASEAGDGWQNGTANAVPLPPSALLLGSALLGLMGWRRFRKS
jgi:hypothetical protein